MTAVASNRPRRLRFGDLLLERGIITREQFERSLTVQRETGKRLGRVLVELGYITEEALHKFL